jgi:hypothetical protein
MVQWEYRQETIPPDPPNVQAVCNKAGADGWELGGMLLVIIPPAPRMINGVLHQGGQATPMIMLQFKRPIAPAPNPTMMAAS